MRIVLDFKQPDARLDISCGPFLISYGGFTEDDFDRLILGERDHALKLCSGIRRLCSMMAAEHSKMDEA